ncbi:hypothetical protein O6R08_06025 [Cutibacterium equinum]|uniref:Uncharacterized protein n=1 Tax=Cutibacterium equinum TaxID=3016342 RepID=A0ABY7QVL6_9ACTN|nr:hypothetical protein [Cutibacterium equinum]WCC79121.1 hypothetical protein O6R08_06025 [Cutibacterium equinum]
MSNMPSMDRDSILNGAAGYLMEELERRGIAVQAVLTESGKALEIADQGMLSMENVADELMACPVAEWEPRLQRWLQMVVSAVESETAPAPSREEIMTMIRTRLVPAAETQEYGYARHFSDDLSLILCLDFPTHVAKLADDTIAELGISVEELFAQGQQNTNAEPIDEMFDEDDVHFITGDSMFIASKVADMPALLNRLGVDVPSGVLFAVPNRSTFMYRVPTAGAGLSDLICLSQMLSSLSPDAGYENPGGVLSNNIYYWTPDGTLEPQMGNFGDTMEAAARAGADVDWSEDDTITLRPGPIFTANFIKAAR